MKVIVDNLISSVTADSAATDWPAANVLDNSPKKVWQAASGVVQASLRCNAYLSSSGLVSGIGIFNTNATSAIINISDPNKINWVDVNWEDVNWVTSSVSVTKEIVQSGAANALWGEFAGINGGVQIDIILSAPETVFAGVVVVGNLQEFSGPNWGLRKRAKNYSILKEFSNGAEYHRKRDIVDRFIGQSLQSDADAESLYDIYKSKSYEPMAWRFFDTDGNRWIKYARFDGEGPDMSYDFIDAVVVDFELKEVV